MDRNLSYDSRVMKQMIRWETLILETVQSGGTLVFLRDKAPSNLDEWLSPLQTSFLGEIPFVKREAQDFISGKFKTKSQDVIFLFSSQREVLVSVNSVLQGQRVFLGEEFAGEKDGLVDFVWPSCDLPSWTQTFLELKSLWGMSAQILDFQGSHQSPCLFLDRDDVVVKNVPYNKDPDKVELVPGIDALISQAHQRGYWVAMVTNQSGLGRGWISWPEYQSVHQRTLGLLAEKGCWLDECVWSAYIDQEAVAQGRLLAGLRKPRAGMFQLVNSKLKVDMANSVMVGDSSSDLIAAFGAGVGKLCLLSSDKLQQEELALGVYQKRHPDFNFSVVQRLSEISL